MQPKLKPVKEQVIVITGASSGIGLATAELAVEKGAKVVMFARSENSLQEITDRLSSNGKKVIAVTGDVAKRSDVESAAREAFRAFGRIDTWINNAGVSIYGKLDQVKEEDSRRLFDTNYWGVVNGSLVALSYLRQDGGALINVGSEVSDAVIPLQGMYSASKHAVKGFTDALRIEVEKLDKLPVSITLIQPTAVNTPYPQHAKNYMDKEPKLPSPMIDPRKVAEEILEAAAHPVRSAKIGLMSKVNTTIAKVLPALGDKMSAAQTDRQHYNEKPRNPNGALYDASEEGRVYGSGGVE